MRGSVRASVGMCLESHPINLIRNSAGVKGRHCRVGGKGRQQRLCLLANRSKDTTVYTVLRYL